MNTFDARYAELVKLVRQAPLKNTRQGIAAHMVPGNTFEHHMSEGFPLTTLRNIKFDLIASELEFNIQGHCDKRWLQDRDNHIWDDWCDPTLVPYGVDQDTRKKMREERDLGPLYGFQWRHFGAKYYGYDHDYKDQGVDQLKWVLQMLKDHPESKRMVVSCWNPANLDHQAIPPCPFAFEISVFENEMHLFFFQRSADVLLGFPFDFAQHALLLHLISSTTGYKEGKVTAFLGNVELYSNQEGPADELLSRPVTHDLPTLETTKIGSIFEWHYNDSQVKNYEAHPPMKIDIAV